MPLVRRGDEVLLAVRSDPVRQVWVGAHSAQFAGTTDFVVLWTNIFDWLGEGGEQVFGAEGIAALGTEWSASPAVAEQGLLPAMYRRGDGAVKAVNALDVTAPRLPSGNWRSGLEKVAESAGLRWGGVALAPVLLVVALAALGVAAAAWPRRPAGSSLTRF